MNGAPDHATRDQPNTTSEAGAAPDDTTGDGTTRDGTTPDDGTPDDTTPDDNTGADAEPADLEAIGRDLDGVEAALARLDDGSYWTDEITGAPIPDEVLAADPVARRADPS